MEQSTEGERRALIGWLDDVRADVEKKVRPIPDDLFRWRPHPDANNGSVTAWHFTRWLDFLVTCYYEDRPPTEQHWWKDGWVARTGYDPSGLGIMGAGLLSGYTPAEARAVPFLAATSLLTYFNAVTLHLRETLAAIPSADLTARLQRAEPRYGGTPLSTLTRTIYRGVLGHLGEIVALANLGRLMNIDDEHGPRPKAHFEPG